MRSTPESVTEKAVGAVKWSALMEAVSRVVSPIVIVILARLLAPEDFGVVAAATIVIGFSQMFWDAGLGKALVQTEEPPEKAAHVVFWTNLILGILIYVTLLLASSWLADLFHTPTSGLVLQVLGFQIVIGSLTSVQQALFERDLGFRQLFWVKSAAAFVPGFFSIPLAFFGYGVWALVAGSLAGSLLNLALLWGKSTWRPRMCYDWHIARKLMGFGVWVVGESFGVWFLIWGDNLLVGKFLGVEDLGVYRVGWTISTTIFGLLLSPFLPVLYPSFSRLQEERPLLKSAFGRVNRVVIMLALPMGVGLLLLGPELASALFGDKWHGLGMILGVIGFMHGMSWLVGVNPQLYRAIGRPDVNTKLMFASIIYYLPAYLLAAPRGLEAFTFTRLGVALVTIPLHIYLCVRMLHVSPLYLWHQGKYMVLATIVMALAVSGIKQVLALSGSSGLVVLAVLIAVGITTYGGTLWLLDRPFVIQTKGLIKRAVLA
ncbi:MAG: lipopolysaccharide biosynthesis protein [Deltaproteobacteria bacterium]|jgi:O-antigen/teichoic acid export membrane protein